MEFVFVHPGGRRVNVWFLNAWKYEQFLFDTVSSVISFRGFDIENSLLDSVLGLLMVFLVK
jgi:hypothetical protein